MTPHDALEWAKVAASVAGPTVAVAGAAWRYVSAFTARLRRMSDRLARQDAELAAQSRQLEWQSRMLELVGRRQGTVPPPREKLATLDAPFDAPPESRRNE